MLTHADSAESNRSMKTVVGRLGPRQKRGLVAWIVLDRAISSVCSTSENIISASLNELGCSQSTLCSSDSPPDIMRRAALGVPRRRSEAEYACQES